MTSALIASLALAAASTASANTRAGDGGTYYTVAAATPVGAFPEGVWFLPEESSEALLWPWLVGGAAFFAALSLVISNQSNGAN